MTIYTKNRNSFFEYYDNLKQMIFYREIENNKVEIKISLSCFTKEVKKLMKLIKD